MLRLLHKLHHLVSVDFALLLVWDYSYWRWSNSCGKQFIEGWELMQACLPVRHNDTRTYILGCTEAKFGRLHFAIGLTLHEAPVACWGCRCLKLWSPRSVCMHLRLTMPLVGLPLDAKGRGGLTHHLTSGVRPRLFRNDWIMFVFHILSRRWLPQLVGCGVSTCLRLPVLLIRIG